jgi:hypothetical protein
MATSRKDETAVVPSWIRQILEMFARGDLSLLNPTQPKQRRKRVGSKAGAVRRELRGGAERSAGQIFSQMK